MTQILFPSVRTIVQIDRHGEGNREWHQIDVNWDNGRTLMIVSPPDRFEILPNAK